MSPLHHEKSWTDLFGFGICPRPLFTLFYPLLFLLSLFWHHHIETNYICSELNRMGENSLTHSAVTILTYTHAHKTHHHTTTQTHPHQHHPIKKHPHPLTSKTTHTHTHKHTHTHTHTH